MTRRIGTPSSWPSTRHRRSDSFSIGSCGSTVHVAWAFGMGAHCNAVESSVPGDLSVTALYTSYTWLWGGFPCADLLASAEAKRVFDATNAALWVARKDGLRHALVQRHAMIDHVLRESACTRVLELAAGLSQRGAAFAMRLHYTEVDLPPVIRKKRELLARTAAGRAVLERLELVEGDVATVALPVATEPTLVIAEGLLIY